MILVLWFLVLSILTVLYVGLPLYGKEELLYVDDEEIQDLLLERERAYTALLDLDFDFEVGKVSEADYQQLRQQLMSEAAQVLASIDRGAPSKQRPRGAPTQPDDWVEGEIERFKRQRRKAR